MAYDQALAGRVRRILAGKRGWTERELFGGIGFMLNGNMACGIIKRSLVVRVGPEAHEAAMRLRGAGEFKITGRPSRGWIRVGPGALTSATQLRVWVERGIRFARTLPPK